MSTHAIQKSAGDERVDVGLGYLDLEAAKSSLTTFAHPLHADGAGATVWLRSERTGFCSYELRNRDHKQFIKRTETSMEAIIQVFSFLLIITLTSFEPYSLG